MKKYFICVTLVVLFSVFMLKKSEKSVFSDSPIYNSLLNEDFGPLDEEKTLNIILGFDYLPYEFVEIFEELTGVHVVVDVFDSNEILEAKLLAGGSQYDVVFPTAWPNFSRQITAQIYQPIDKKRVDFSKFSQPVLEKLATYDKNNTFGIPYQFGISGIGVDMDMIGSEIAEKSEFDLDVVLNPENAEKLSKLRFCVYDSPEELFPVVLSYLNLAPETVDEQDIIKAAEHLKKIRPYIYKFTAFGFEDLSSRNVAVTFGTSGDILKVKNDNPKRNIKFFYPKKGTALWVDVVAIPKGARHTNNVYAFFKFLFHPKVISAVTNKTFRANCVEAAGKFVDKEIIKNQSIYPTVEFCKKCYIERPVPQNIEILRTRLLTKIKSML